MFTGSGAVTIDGQLNEKSVSELEFSIKFFLSENLCKKGTNIHVGIDVLNGVDKYVCKTSFQLSKCFSLSCLSKSYRNIYCIKLHTRYTYNWIFPSATKIMYGWTSLWKNFKTSFIAFLSFYEKGEERDEILRFI